MVRQWESGGVVSARADPRVQDRLVQATMRLLEREGPTAIKARTVAAEAGLTTAAVYNHFGGIAELTQAVRDAAFVRLEADFSTLEITDDPVSDVFGLALRIREFAHASPHRYDLMFGLSARGTYRSTIDGPAHLSGHSPAFLAAYQHLLAACERMVRSHRLRDLDPAIVGARLWSMVHGFVSLEIGRHFDRISDPVEDVLKGMGVALLVEMGDSEDAARASMRARP